MDYDKAFRRAAALLQDTFLIIRERTLIHKFISLERRNNEIILHTDENTACLIHEDGAIVRYSPQLTSDEKLKKSALCCIQCNHSETWTYELTEYLLKDVQTGIRNIEILTKNEVFKVIPPNYSGEEYMAHAVREVTLHSGKMYCLDLTGSQYGWYDEEPLEWASFISERRRSTVRVKPHDDAANQRLDERCNRDAKARAETRFRMRLVDAFNKEMGTYMTARPQLGVLLAGYPEQEYDTERALFLDAVKEAIEKTVVVVNPQWKGIVGVRNPRA